ncbi:MAG TPA: hypothetical protein VK927_08550, partial [Adhaeribacter sp.]|nr:hypothetical protein [Adhaeribacter sp.]
MANFLLDQSCREPKSGNSLDGLANNSLKKIRNGKKGIFMLACMLLSLVFSTQVEAQTVVTVGTGTGASGANVLFSTNTGGNLWSKSASLYTAAEIATAGGASGNITKIAWNKQGTGEYTFGDAVLDIYIKAVSKNDQSAASLDWTTNLGTATLVYSTTNLSFMTGTGWQEFTLQTPFQWDGSSNLEVFTAFHHPTQLTAAMTWEFTVVPNTNLARVGSSEVNTQALLRNSNRPNIQFTINPGTACIAPPTAGTATTTETNTCVGNLFTLNLTGASFGAGQTYQWETSPNGTTGWTPIGTSSNSPVLTTSQTAGTHFYRAAVTCSGQTANSTSVSVTSPALVSGNFTIDNNAPVSATNFQSFTSAVNSLSCGINGPVTFTVDPASGPYTEQFEIPEINGTSATNTITFQGNGRTISADPVTGNRAVIKLNGADFVTINNLNIQTTGVATGSFGWGIHFTNGADNNTI